MTKHEHDWQLVRVYFKTLRIYPFTEERVSSWACNCGCMKEVKIRDFKEVRE